MGDAGAKDLQPSVRDTLACRSPRCEVRAHEVRAHEVRAHEVRAHEVSMNELKLRVKTGDVTYPK